ncbi:MAG: flagellar motor switch protein FliN [Bryobacterales bacterium]|nr:flagellar motor switch protein FliN [Bryobacterales bacterium]
MTMKTSSDPVSPQSIAAEFRTRLAASLEMLCGAQVDVVESPAPSGISCEWRAHPLDTEPASQLFTGAPEIIGRAVGARVLSAAGLDDFTDEDVSGSYTEVLQSALSAVAQYLSRALGSDVALLETTVRAPDSSAAFEVAYQLQFEDQTLSPLCFGVSPSLLQLLAAQTEEAADRPAPDRAVDPPPMGRAPANLTHTGTEVDDLHRVLDLELPIRVSFGKAKVALKDVLKLSTGSIVELDRSIHDPVEIIVNDRVIGRGEVVVTEGNYGVRIQEIVSLGSA